MTVRLLQSAWRFSRNELSGKRGAVHARAFRLVQEPGRVARIQELRALIADHARHMLTPMTVSVPEEAGHILQTLARLVAAGRTPVRGGGWSGDELMPEGGEDPLRVFQQLRGLLVSLAHIHGTTTPNPRALRLVRDVALSSFEPRRAEAVLVQRLWPVAAIVTEDGRRPVFPMTYRHGLTIPQLAAEWGDDTAARVMRELQAVGLYVVAGPELVPPSEEKAGKRPELYEPTPALAAVLNGTFETWPPRLVTVMDLFQDRAGTYRGRLSPPDARLEAVMGRRRADFDSRLRDALRRLHQEQPELGERLSLQALQEVTGIRFDLWTVEGAAPGSPT